MNILDRVAPVISNPLTIYSVIGVLALWTIVSLARLWVKTGTLVRALNRARQVLNRAADSAAFASQYEALNDELARDSVLGARWRAFRESLVLPARPGQLVRATVRPAEWFDLGLLRTVGTDLRYHAAMPNMLVGAGLLFTFLGLAVALASASGVVAGTSTARNDALRTLLDTASFKFLTSLAGMALSIFYALVRKWRIHKVERAEDRLHDTLEHLVPLVTPITLQHEQLALMERQATLMETFSNDLAVSLGSAFDQAFNERLAEHVGPLTVSMQRLSESMDSRNQDAMKEMLDAFLSKLEGGASDHMKAVAESLSGLGEQLSSVQGGLGEAAMRMAQSADTAATRMGQGAEAALSRITEQMGGVAEALRAVAEQTRDAGNEAIEGLARRIADAAGTFETTAAQVATVLERSASETGGAFGRGAEDAVARIVEATEGMREEIRGVLAELRSAVGDAGAFLRSGGEQSAEALRSKLDAASAALAAAMDEAAGRIAAAGGEAASALERGGSGASERLVGAADVISARSSGFASEVTRLAEAADGLAKRAEAFERVAGEAALPLTNTASDLKAAGTATRDGLAALAQSTQGVARAVEQVAGVAQRLDATASAVGELSASLDGAAERFAGVDQELARTLTGLQGGLQGFTKQVGEFVVGTDTNLAKAAIQLASLVKSLEDTLEDYAPHASSGGRR